MKLHTEGSFFTAAVFALCASFILLTSGCIKVNLDITVDRDGSGTYGGEFATSKVFIETFNEETDGLSCDQIFEDETSDLNPFSGFPPGAEVELFEDENWCGYNFSASFSDFGVGVEDDEGFPITEDEGIVTFRLPADDLFGDLTDEAVQSEDIDPEMLLKAFGIPDPEFIISVSIAGEILEDNADEIRGATLVWNFDVFNSQPGLAPYAIVDTTVSNSGSSSTSGGLIAVMIIAGLTSLTLLGVLQRRFAANENTTESNIV